LEIAEGSNPCSASSSLSENAETCSGEVTPTAFSARLAGAERRDKNPSWSWHGVSQTGQVGQSLLFNICAPFYRCVMFCWAFLVMV
jgi:hypothetical protein